jgi:hypothetical protein
MAKIHVALLAATALVDALVAANQAAIHIFDEDCGLGDGNANFVLAPRHRVVITSSGILYLLGAGWCIFKRKANPS